MLPSVRQLQYFVAVAEAGQISRAGGMMNVTQSSITIAIRALEDLLGYRLLHRRSKGVDLTARGQVFLRHAVLILSELEALADLSPVAPPDYRGRVSIGVTTTVSGYFLPSLLTTLEREVPGLELDLVERPRIEIERAVLQNELDLGLVLISDITDISRFETCPLLVSKRQLWHGAGHRLAKFETVSLADLNDEKYILVSSDDHEEMMMQNWRRHGFSPKIIFRTGSLEAVRSMVAAGHGVTILSDLVHRSWSLETKRIYRKTLREDISVLETGLIWPTGGCLGDAAARLIDVARHHHARISREKVMTGG